MKYCTFCTFTALYFTALYCTFSQLYGTVLYLDITVLYGTVQYCTALSQSQYFTVLYLNRLTGVYDYTTLSTVAYSTAYYKCSVPYNALNTALYCK
jgi:hypothetical protein